MNEKKQIDMKASEISMVSDILGKYLPHDAQCWVFGSRARKDAKPYSDLDLAIDMHGKLASLEILAALSVDFDESDLPYKVDLIDWNSIDNTFQKHIILDRILFFKDGRNAL